MDPIAKLLKSSIDRHLRTNAAAYNRDLERQLREAARRLLKADAARLEIKVRGVPGRPSSKVELHGPDEIVARFAKLIPNYSGR